MNDTKFSVLVALLKIMAAHHKFWCYASQATMLKYLEKYQGIKICRRSLNYHLKDMRDLGLIRTIGRKRRNPDGTLALLTSAHCITIKGYRYLASKGIQIAWQRAKALAKRYLPERKHKPAYSRQIVDTPEETKQTRHNPYMNGKWRKKHGFTETPPFALKK
jgi:hypothetical protein